MDYAALAATRSRAGALAARGLCKSLEEIRAQLEWEGRPYIVQALRGGVRIWLRNLIYKAQQTGPSFDA